MKNFKRIALGLLVGAMAIGFSAFTNAHTGTVQFPVKHSKVGNFTPIADNANVQLNTLNNFQEAENPSSDDCVAESTTLKCIYDVTSAGAMNIPDQPSGYSTTDISNYLSQSPAWLAPRVSGGNGVLNP